MCFIDQYIAIQMILVPHQRDVGLTQFVVQK